MKPASKFGLALRIFMNMKFYANIFIVGTSAYGLCSMLEHDQVYYSPSQNWKIQDYFLFMALLCSVYPHQDSMFYFHRIHSHIMSFVTNQAMFG